MMLEDVRRHYERHPYPHFSLLASVRSCDTYALNVESLWARANGTPLPPGKQRILLAGCGSFSPYPTSVANPQAEITALDLSEENLRRARLHALLHGCTNLSWQQGNLLDSRVASGPFAFIDAFGVLHHLPDPKAGLQALERRLAPGGIIRLMVYSRSARRDAESARRALRLLQVRDLVALKAMIRKAEKSSRLRRLLDDFPEAGFDSGLADMLLHPQVTTFRIDDLLQLISSCGLHPLFFAHSGALPSISAETERLRHMELGNNLHTNFIIYLGRATAIKGTDTLPGKRLMLNPVLRRYVGRFCFRRVAVAPKLGMVNPVLDGAARKFLRKFTTPRPCSELEVQEAKRFLAAMFLVAFQDE